MLKLIGNWFCTQKEIYSVQFVCVNCNRGFFLFFLKTGFKWNIKGYWNTKHISICLQALKKTYNLIIESIKIVMPLDKKMKGELMDCNIPKQSAYNIISFVPTLNQF